MLTDKPISPSSFPLQALQHNNSGPAHLATGKDVWSTISSAVPLEHLTLLWHHTMLLPSWKRPVWAMGTHAAQQTVFTSLFVPGKEWWGLMVCWLINTISISKASSENQYPVFKEVLLPISAFRMSRVTGRNQRVITLCKSKNCCILLTMEPRHCH